MDDRDADADQVLAAVAPGLRVDQLARKAAALEMKLDARAYVRYIGDTLVRTAGELFEATDIPEDLRPKVARLLSQQLHHLAKKATGWPTDALPVPDRSDWR